MTKWDEKPEFDIQFGKYPRDTRIILKEKAYLTGTGGRDKMGYRAGDETYEFEGKIEHTTAKAYLVVPTMGVSQVWVPKSQVVSMGDADIDGNRVFVVTEWWWNKQEGL